MWDGRRNSLLLHTQEGLVGPGPLLGMQATEVVSALGELGSMQVQGIARLNACPEGI